MNTGVYAEMRQHGTIQWVTAGGDHSTDFWGGFGGINLSYGRKSGFNSYGPKFEKRGTRIFDMTFDKSTGGMDIETWIREEDGEKDMQDDFNAPASFSWLKSSYCYGSENLSKSDWKDFLANPVSPY